MSYVLDVERVSVSYRDANIVNGVSLRVDKGEVVAVVGTNGSGKTSLFHVVTGGYLLRGMSVQGRVHLEGVNVTDMMPHERLGAGLVGVPDDGALFPELTVRENLKVGGSNPASVRGLSLFSVIEDRVATEVKHLSGGEQKAVALCRLLSLEAEVQIAVMDEPLRGLDEQALDLALEEISEYQRQYNTSLLVLTQEQNLKGEIYDRIINLVNGELCEQG